jgi:hypothetical protein
LVQSKQAFSPFFDEKSDFISVTPSWQPFQALRGGKICFGYFYPSKPILGENEALKKVEILSLSQESVVSVHFGSNATRTQSLVSQVEII